MSKTSAFLIRIFGRLAVAWLGASPAFAGGHGGYQGGFHGGGGGFHGSGMHAASGGGQHAFGGGHGGFAAPHFGVSPYGSTRYAAGGYAHSYAPGYNGGYGHRPGWGGGYWRGRYWPGAYFRSGFSWFLPVLPLGYMTLWWGGLPYYYWDDAYYLWSPQRRGYVVTDPPPVAESASDANDEAPATGAAAELYVYPRKGQTDAQTAADRFECHQWAVGQTGFDPSRTANPSGSNEPGYQRAVTACLDARGYSVR